MIKSLILTMAMTTEPASLHPYTAAPAAGNYILQMAYRTWTYLDENSVWKPMLAQKIPSLQDKTLSVITENGHKKTVAIWDIKTDAKWGDGTKITCKDARFGWEVGSHKNAEVNYKSAFDDIEDITWDEKIPTRCRFKFRNVKWNFYWDLPGPLPAHLEESIFKQHASTAEAYGQNSLYRKTPSAKGLWNGPYVVTEVVHGSHVVLEANANFFGSPPKIKKIIVKTIPNTSTLKSHLLSGSINMISRIGLSLDEALSFEKEIAEKNLPYKVNFKDSFAFFRVQLNLDNPILKDIRVRQALLEGFDPSTLDKVFEGKLLRATHYLSPQDPNYSDKYTLVAGKSKGGKKHAGELLSQAGWILGQDGFRYKNGEKLTLSLITTAGPSINATIQVIVQEQWKKLGFDIRLKTVTANLLYSEIFGKRTFDMCAYSNYLLPGDSAEELLHSKGIPSVQNNENGQNVGGINNPKIDQGLEALRIEADPAKRKKITEKILKEYVAMVPVIPLYFRLDSTVLPKDFKGFKPTGSFFYESLQSEHWEF